MPRRSPVVVALLMCVLTAPGASAAGSATLDGQRAKTHAYTGSLAGPSVYAGAGESRERGWLRPRPDWCTAQTCDITDLDLRLPPGRQSGRLVVELAYNAPAAMHLGVYTANGTELSTGSTSCCGGDRMVATSLPAGRYRVVVYDDAGAGRFEVQVTWQVNPPHRSATA